MIPTPPLLSIGPTNLGPPSRRSERQRSPIRAAGRHGPTAETAAFRFIPEAFAPWRGHLARARALQEGYWWL